MSHIEIILTLIFHATNFLFKLKLQDSKTVVVFFHAIPKFLL